MVWRGTRRVIFNGGSLSAPSSPAWPTGADGALSIDGGEVEIDAGDVKDYSSISIINNGILTIRGAIDLGLGVNDGSQITVIGCSGNCTINTGGKIQLLQNAFEGSDLGSSSFLKSRSTPSGAAVSSVSYNANLSQGGSGGASGYGYGGGSDSNYTGHGAGGGGASSGLAGPNDGSWGVSGAGGNVESAEGSGYSPGVDPEIYGFGIYGINGSFGEGDTSFGVGGGASGGVRGYNGGCLYLQVAGTLSVSGTVIEAYGQDGGNGAIGGDGNGFDSGMGGEGYGGGGGGGGAGGSGGKIIVRYKSGSIASGNISVVAGSGGAGGAGGSDVGGGGANGNSGFSGNNGSAGSTDLASY